MTRVPRSKGVDLLAQDAMAATVPRASFRPIDTRGIHPDIMRQPISMFCSKQRHVETFYFREVDTVAQAIEYVKNYGTPPGVSQSVWREMVTRMKMWRTR